MHKARLARCVEQNRVAWVWWCRSPTWSFAVLHLELGHQFHEPVTETLAHVFCDRLRRLLEEFLEDFHANVDTDLEVDSPVALGKLELFLRAPCILPRMRQKSGFWTNFTHFLRDGELES